MVAEPIIGDFPTFFVLTWTIPSCKLLDMEGDNEEELSFVRLAAVTANVVRWLMETHEQKTEQGKGNEAKNDSDTQKQVERDVQQRAYVDQRLCDLQAFERRARGVK